MSGVFNLIDRGKFLAGEADYDGGQVPPPPGVQAEPVGMTLDTRIAGCLVRFFFFLDKGGAPHSFAIWKPDRLKRLKPAHLKKYRRERRDFVTAVAKQFGIGFHVVDRMDGDGAPRVRELVYPDGTIEPVTPAVPFIGPRTH